MTRIEHRLADALAARAKAVDPKTIRPLPWAAPVRHRRERRRRWLAPAAAAISIAIVASAVAFLPRHARRPNPAQDHPITAQYANFPGKLMGVDALSATDAWAVGTMFRDQKGSETSNFEPLIMHWNGKNWRRVPVPSKVGPSSLVAVSGSSPDDVWAVGGWTQSLHHTGKALILHWNGKNWRLAPSIGSFKVAGLSAVSARSATDAWAVGDSGNSGALLLHWNGRSWRQVPVPHPDPSQYLLGVTDVSSGDAWAVGADKRRALLLHWNGTRLRIASNPYSRIKNGALLDLTALSASEIWALGYAGGRTNVLRWNGAAWHVAPAPRFQSAKDALLALAVISPDDIWGGGYEATHVSIRHWNGTGWSAPKGFEDDIPGLIDRLSVLSASDIWAVGYRTSQKERPIILHWNGKSWIKALS